MAATLSGLAATNDRIECGTPDVPASTPGLTIMGWAEPTDRDTRRILSKATDTPGLDHTWMISCNGPDWRSRINAGGTTTTLTAGTTTLSTWQHVACRYDGSNDLNYVDDGASAGSAANSGDVEVDATAEYWIGSQPPSDTANIFEGALEDVRVYARAISEAELETIFNSNGHDGIVHGLILRHPLNDNSSGTIGSGATRARGLGSLQQDGIGVNGPTWTVGENIMAPRRRYR